MTNKEMKLKLNEFLESGVTDIEIKCGYCDDQLICSPLTKIHISMCVDYGWKYFWRCPCCKHWMNPFNPKLTIKTYKV